MTAVTLICFRADPDPTIRTYAAVRSSQALRLVANGVADLEDAETVPWDVLPGMKRLAAARIRREPERAVLILGTTEGRAWATWHLPVDPPQVPA